jgi:hypothetical protein
MVYRKDSLSQALAQESWAAACTYRERLQQFLAPLLQELDKQLDRRLVRTFADTIEALVRFRDRARGLLLSELGAQLLSPAHAPAGTKRLSNLLRSRRWSAKLLEEFVWRRADWRLHTLEAQGQDVLAVWDESELEKAESLASEGLCAVRSRKAARLKHIRPGYYNPPGGRPICVPGLHWLGVLLLGWQGPPTLAAMHWWTTRGERASDRRTEEFSLLNQCAQAWGPRVLHVWDRGFAGNPWLSLVLCRSLRFVVRWPKRYHLLDAQGQERPAWQIARGKRSWASYALWDPHHSQWRKMGVLAFPVKHPEHAHQLWLVVSRPGKGRPPWYLLTTEPIFLAEDAWQIVLAYSRRWQIEMAWRYSKSELAMESPRLWFWENRTKLLLMVSLVYAFLLSLLDPTLKTPRDWLLRHWCHRTGKRSQKSPAPLYRLRSALSALWLAHPAQGALYESSG